MLLGRPIPVWLIFLCGVFVAGCAGWVALIIAMAQPGDDYARVWEQYGALSLVVVLTPASVLLLAGISLLFLKKWAVWPLGLTALIILPFLWRGTSVDVTTAIWLVGTLGALAYAIWLRRRGILS
jgi:hypothetical protein